MRTLWEQSKADIGDAKKIDFHLEDREDNTSTYGWASVAEPGNKPVPPWERSPVTHISVGEDVLPEMKVGGASPPFEAIVSREDAINRLDGIGDYNWWYRIASPWGNPILTPFEVAYMLYQGLRKTSAGPTRSLRLRTPMDAGTDMVVYHPLFVDQTYIMKSRLCDKWQTPRSVFFCTEYSYQGKSGELVALMRTYSAHFISDLSD